MVLPTLDLLLHNLIALGLLVVAVLLLAQLVRVGVLGLANRLLRFAAFKKVTEADRLAFRKRVGRVTLVTTSLLCAALIVAALVGTGFNLRALDLARTGVDRLRAQDFATFNARLLRAFAVAVGGLVVDALARAIVAALGRLLARSARLAARSEPLAEIIVRLRTATRVVVLCAAALLISAALELSPATQRSVLLVSYVLIALYGSRLIVSAGHLVVDLLFDSSGKLATLESPLRYLGNLTHLVGITKRALDYFVFVGAATWVANEFSPETWIARGGSIGIRVIAIFYASRVVVEICVLFITELFISKAPEESETDLQRRKTLVPVAVGLLRYGIYFSAIIMVLREASIDPTPLLAGAGVIGVAVGLGAQAFVGDIVAGFFILFENLLLVGDLVEVSSVRGKVEEIGVRITKIRDDSGVLHAIPNGEVRKVANHSKIYVNAVVDVFVPYESDMRMIRALLLATSEKVLERETGKRGPIEVKVQELSEGSVTLRVAAKVPPGKDEDMADALRSDLLDALRDAKIGAPRMRRAVLVDSGVGIAPPPEGKEEDDDDNGPPDPFKPPEPED